MFDAVHAAQTAISGHLCVGGRRLCRKGSVVSEQHVPAAISTRQRTGMNSQRPAALHPHRETLAGANSYVQHRGR